MRGQFRKAKVKPVRQSIDSWLGEFQTDYFVSLCGVCFRQNLQNLLRSSRAVVVRLFFLVK